MDNVKLDNVFSEKDLNKIWKEVINDNFEWGDVNPRFWGLQPGVANIFCPFHDNRHSPAARPYWDEERNILVIHCFMEHRTFTCYDYVKLILCKELGNYKDPGEFIIDKLGAEKYLELCKVAQMGMSLSKESSITLKKEYINNVYNEHAEVCGFINELYLAE